MSYVYKDLQEMWQKMWDAQVAKDGFTLTIRELMNVFELKSTSAVLYRLQMLEEAGMVRSILSGSKRTYRALPKEGGTNG